MKVQFKHLIAGYTGKADGMVIYYNRALNRVLIRRQPKVKRGAHHDRFKAISQNIFGLAPSLQYREDLMRYAHELHKLKAYRYDGVVVWNNLYSRIMFNLAKKYPETIDLATLTRAEIEADNLPCRSVRQAVEADLIPYVRGYESMTNVM